MEIVKNKTGRSRPNAPRRQPDARLVHSVACGRGIVRRLSGPMNSCRRPPKNPRNCRSRPSGRLIKSVAQATSTAATRSGASTGPWTGL